MRPRNCYLVGGCVRDTLLGVEFKDKDFVVVGSTPEEMINLGFKQVGADFPVFIHPETGEEYALARKEKKKGGGYCGFNVDFSPDTTLEEDLARRDITINAIAAPVKDKLEFNQNDIIDPFGGREDINRKILRHTTDAFKEDPVRVLRIARFLARFGKDWNIAEETKKLIFLMGKSGDLKELKPDRVWKELSMALLEHHPRLFFDTLLECDVLHIVFPEIYRLKSALEFYTYHSEGNAYEHTMMVLEQAALLKLDLIGRLAALTHDFGKGITPKDKLPHHYSHERTGVDVIDDFSKRASIPKQYKKILKKLCRTHMLLYHLPRLKAKTIVKLFINLGAWNDPDIVQHLYHLGICDVKGRAGYDLVDTSFLNGLLALWDIVQTVSFKDVFPEGEVDSKKIEKGLYQARVSAVKRYLQTSNRNEM